MRMEVLYRERIIASGMLCPPRATRAATRSICCSGELRPQYQILTGTPAAIASNRVWVMVLPPRVVSKIKSVSSRMAVCSLRTPSLQTTLLISSMGRSGYCSHIAWVNASGLYQSWPAARMAEPPIELFPAPLTPARR